MNAMSNTIDVDLTDEDVLTYEISDEALEAAAGPGAAIHTGGAVTTGTGCC
jgi:selenophosphate synthase